MDVARISDRFLSIPKEEVLQNLREAIEETGVQIGLMFGLRESDIRIGSIDPKAVMHLYEGLEVRIVINADNATAPTDLICSNKEFPKLVSPGDRLLIDFGRIIFTVLDVLTGQEVEKSPKLEARSEESLPTFVDDSHSHSCADMLDLQTESSRQIHQSKSALFIERPIKRPVKNKVKCIAVVCRVDNECIFKSLKPVHIQHQSGVPTRLTEEHGDIEDIKNIQWAAAHSLDFLVYKQIANLDDWNELTSFNSGTVNKIVGIQRVEGAENAEELVSVADGVLIGRGMLALESSLEEVCRLQKDIVAKCRRLGKPVIISTHLLMSMIINKSPTRSEVTDITQAVYDGCDALLFSGETAYGHHPVDVIETCHKICIEAEAAIDYNIECALAFETAKRPFTVQENLSHCAVLSAIDLRAKLIVVTASGKEALRVARFRPACPILAVTDKSAVARMLSIVRGVHATTVPSESIDNCLQWYALHRSIIYAKAQGFVCTGDTLIYLGGVTTAFSEGSPYTLMITVVD